MKRRWVVLTVLVALLLGGGALAWLHHRSEPSSRLAAALALAPRTAVRFSWTDWAGVRDELGLSSSTPVAQLLSTAFDHDLDSESALVDSAPVLARSFGFSPADLDWELYAQGTDGAVELMGLPADLDLGDLRRTLEKIGYRAPSSADGLWTHPSLGDIGDLTPELTALTIDSDHHVLAASDNAAFLGRWRGLERGTSSDALASVTDAIGSARSASVYAGDYACSALAMNRADDADQVEGARLIQEAGKLNPMDAFAIAHRSASLVRVAMAFESSDQARTNADTRSRLAVGPAPGQGGSFTDRFTLGRVAADGDVVTMDLRPKPDTYVLSDLDNGPLLFASC
ncbi:hypothetical protein [Nocardioides montaniterrae]